MGVDQFGSTTITKVRIGGTAGVEATEDFEVDGNGVITGTLTVGGVNGIVGSVGATDNRLVRSDGTGTKTVQSTGITVDDSNNVSGVGTLGCGAITCSAGISGTTGTFSSTLSVTGNTAAGGSANATTNLDINGTADSNRSLRFLSAGTAKWRLYSAATSDSFSFRNLTLSADAFSISNSVNTMSIGATLLMTGIRNVTATGNASNPEPAAGTYTPTLTSVANVDSTTAAVCHATRQGNDVHIEGSLAVDVTATTTLTKIGISLPVASAFAAATDANGSGGCTNVAVTTAPEVYADATNDRLELAFTSASTGSHTIRFSVDYTVKN